MTCVYIMCYTVSPTFYCMDTARHAVLDRIRLSCTMIMYDVLVR
jgi:hypothetical protein